MADLFVRARLTGKTYAIERFAEDNYEELVEINLTILLIYIRQIKKKFIN